MDFILGALVGLLIVWAVWRTAQRAKKGGACCGEREEAEMRVRATDRNKAHYPYEVTMDIGGMTCENCARRVENALNRLDGVWATVSLDRRSAKIRCKTAPEEAALREAVRAAGYVATGCGDNTDRP